MAGDHLGPFGGERSEPSLPTKVEKIKSQSQKSSVSAVSQKSIVSERSSSQSSSVQHGDFIFRHLYLQSIAFKKKTLLPLLLIFSPPDTKFSFPSHIVIFSSSSPLARVIPFVVVLDICEFDYYVEAVDEIIS